MINEDAVDHEQDSAPAGVLIPLEQRETALTASRRRTLSAARRLGVCARAGSAVTAGRINASGWLRTAGLAIPAPQVHRVARFLSPVGATLRGRVHALANLHRRVGGLADPCRELNRARLALDIDDPETRKRFARSGERALARDRSAVPHR